MDLNEALAALEAAGTARDRTRRKRHSINSQLISIGICNPRLEAKTLGTARRIGKVEVDHGETSCKTPDATAYIDKTVARARATM